MTKEILLALADRCEREEPSRALDVEIRIAIEASPMAQDAMVEIWEKNRWRPEFVAETYGVERYTTSLDAAVTLIADDVWWDAGPGKVTEDEPLYGCLIEEADLGGEGTTLGVGESNHSCALAICAAALRARAATLPNPTA